MRVLFRLLNLAFLGTFLVSCDGLSSPSAAYDPLARPFEGTFAYVGCEGEGKTCLANDEEWTDSTLVIEKFEGEFAVEDVMLGLESNQLFIGDEYDRGETVVSVNDYYVLSLFGPDIGGPYLFNSIMFSLVFDPYGYEGRVTSDLQIRMYFLERKLTKQKRVDLTLPGSSSRLVFMPKG